MIRRIITAILLIAYASAMHAEEHYVAHIAVGAHAGVSLPKVTFSPPIPQKWGLGPTFGVSVSYAEEKLVGLRAEFNFIQRGWKEDFEESPLNFSRSLQYVSIPLLTHINFGSKRSKCIFNLGPEFSFLIGQSTSSNFDVNHPYEDERWPTKSRMTEQLTTDVKNKFDYGICAGVGFEFYLNPRQSIYVEGRYYFGLGNIYPASKADTFGASRNMSIAVTLGYNFRIR